MINKRLSYLNGLENCHLHTKVPLGIRNVSMTQFSIARHSGAIKYNGCTFIYFPKTDELVRDDVIKWQKNQKKKESKQ